MLPIINDPTEVEDLTRFRLVLSNFFQCYTQLTPLFSAKEVDDNKRLRKEHKSTFKVTSMPGVAYITPYRVTW